MNLENQVTSLELSKKLKELGVKQESLFWWYRKYRPNYHLYTSIELSEIEAGIDRVSAFTVAELGEVIMKWEWDCPEKDREGWLWKEWRPGVAMIPHYIINQPDEDITEADARAKMLVYLLENKLIKV